MGRHRPPSLIRRRRASRLAWLAEYPPPTVEDSDPLTEGERAGARRCPNHLPGGVLCGWAPSRGRRRRADGRVFLRCRRHFAWYSMDPADGDLLRPLASFSWSEVMRIRKGQAA